MKKLAKAKPAPIKDDIELRRWCIENAIRWPVEGPYSNAAVYSAGGGHRTEADVIGRADRIRKWVTTVA